MGWELWCSVEYVMVVVYVNYRVDLCGKFKGLGFYDLSIRSKRLKIWDVGMYLLGV